MSPSEPARPGGPASFTRAYATVWAKSDRRGGAWLALSVGITAIILALV